MPSDYILKEKNLTFILPLAMKISHIVTFETEINNQAKNPFKQCLVFDRNGRKGNAKREPAAITPARIGIRNKAAGKGIPTAPVFCARGQEIPRDFNIPVKILIIIANIHYVKINFIISDTIILKSTIYGLVDF